MRNQMLKGLTVGILLSVMTSVDVAQSISSGTVTGVVTDQSGAVIAKAKVQLKN